VGLAAVVMFGCGGGSSIQPVNLGSGSLVLFGGDAPLCNVFSFSVTITGATLTPQNGGAPVSVLPPGQSLTVDFARLLDFTTVLNLASVPAGTYSQMTLTLADPRLTVIDVTQTPPTPVAITTSLTRATVTIILDPPLTVPENGAVGLLLDFHLLRSVQVDANGQVTGLVNPVISVIQTSASGSDGLGRLDDMHGLVKSVTTTSSDPAFTGSFTLQTRAGTGLVFTIHVTSNTLFEGVTGLGDLTAEAFVEVDAIVDTSGNIVAKEVEVQGTVEASQGKAAFEGLVLAVTRDGRGNATQFNLFVREEHPDVSDSISLRSALVVNLSGATRFGITRPGMNEAQLVFDPTTVGVGQNVIAHGVFHTGSPNTLDAGALFLRPQVLRGNFTELLAVGNDGKTGGFNLAPCSSLFRGQLITVFTFGDTGFFGVSDLNGLSTQRPLHVKGLLFYEPGILTVNGITVPPPSLVMEARRVHQPQP